MTSTVNASTTSGVIVTSDTSGALALQTANTTALTISSGQIATFANPLTSASMPSGSVIQVYNVTAQTTFSTTSTSIVQGPQTATFTLSSNSNKVLVIANFGVYAYSGSALNAYMEYSIYRGSIASGTKLNIANIDSNGSVSGQYTAVGGEIYQTVTLSWLDTPTASTTYSVGFSSHSGQTNAIMQGYNITLMEIKA